MKKQPTPSKKPTFEKCDKHGLHSRTNKTQCRDCGKYACSRCARYKFKNLTGGIHPITRVDQGPRMGQCGNCYTAFYNAFMRLPITSRTSYKIKTNEKETK
jgi:hypothetical protein